MDASGTWPSKTGRLWRGKRKPEMSSRHMYVKLKHIFSRSLKTLVLYKDERRMEITKCFQITHDPTLPHRNVYQKLAWGHGNKKEKRELAYVSTHKGVKSDSDYLTLSFLLIPSSLSIWIRFMKTTTLPFHSGPLLTPAQK